MRLVTALALFAPGIALAQQPAEYVALVEVDASNGAITLDFDTREPMVRTEIRRRPISQGEAWSSEDVVADLGDETYWTDPDAVPGEAWEYYVRRYPADGSPSSVEAFVAASLEAPVVDERGTVVLIVDATVADPLAAEIDRLIADMTGDGWAVRRHDVARDMAVADVKALIAADADDAGGDVAVFLLGHVPVPYSGALNPDAHPDHYGAWPADTYYAEHDMTWGDTAVDTTVASRTANHNVPGDGKFDPSALTSEADLMVGRVDMYDMPAFAPLTEVDLLKRYLDKDHAWRSGEITPTNGALIDDNFGSYAPGAKSGWALSPLVGRDALIPGDWLTALPTTSWTWAYGNGGGSYTSAGGVASTSDFAANPLHATFTMIFGSYHGDWDVTDNLMRAAIAADGDTLTCAWAGRPNWYNHTMGVGEPIGHAARWSTNNSYNVDWGGRGVHIALLGDPTLRLDPLMPATGLAASAVESDVTLSWTASPDPSVTGYHVYRSADGLAWDRLTDEPIAETTFADSVDVEGTWTYQVRAVGLTEGFSGSYWNNATGAFAPVDVVCEGDSDSCLPVSDDTGDGDGGGDDEGGGCGCATGTSGAYAWAPLLALGLLRRRKRA
jgi:uncharacterized protein (TIGR03382 family)